MGLTSYSQKKSFNMSLLGGKNISVDNRFGNLILIGNSKSALDYVLANYSITSLNDDIALIIFRNATTGISAYPTITTQGMMIYSLDCTDANGSEQIDIFAGLTENDIDAYIIKIFDKYEPFEKSKKLYFHNYVSLFRNLVKRTGKKVTLQNMHDWDIDDLEMINMQYVTDPIEQQKNERFLNAIRPNIIELESYFHAFSQSIAGEIFSGNKSIEQILSRKSIVEVSLDFSFKKEESTLIMSVLVELINRINVALTGRKSINVVLDGIPSDVLINSDSLRLINNGRGFHVLYTVPDISTLLEKSGNDWIERADTLVFCRQNSDKNKELCSKFFGEYEKQKESYTSSKTTPSFLSYLMGGGGGPSRTNSRTVTTEKERVYPPEFFASMPDKQILIYYKPEDNHMVVNL